MNAADIDQLTQEITTEIKRLERKLASLGNDYIALVIANDLEWKIQDLKARLP